MRKLLNQALAIHDSELCAADAEHNAIEVLVPDVIRRLTEGQLEEHGSLADAFSELEIDLEEFLQAILQRNLVLAVKGMNDIRAALSSHLTDSYAPAIAKEELAEMARLSNEPY